MWHFPRSPNETLRTVKVEIRDKIAKVILNRLDGLEGHEGVKK